MIFCKKCLYPDTKPDLTFNNDGVCSACIAFEARKVTDWSTREDDFKKLVKWAKDHDAQYDCIVPVSGGKDSYYQVIKAKEYGLKPLCVNARTCDLSSLGRDNLDGISLLGFDLLEVVPAQNIRRKLNRYALETIGDISWPEHVLIFTVPVQIAIEKSIPLILWGENPQDEYGGPEEWRNNSELVANRWLAEFGGLNGLRVSDMLDAIPNISSSDLNMYRYPSNQEKVSKVRQAFLGHYFQWDGLENAKLACQHGFNEPVFPVETSGFYEENLDNYQTGLHDYFKFLKYGFGRATDMCNREIKRGRMTRDEGIKHVKELNKYVPLAYLGKDLEEIVEPLGMTIQDVVKIANKFANKDLFSINPTFWPRIKFEVK